MKKKISVEALADIIAPGKRGEVRSVRYDETARVIEVEFEDAPLRPLFVLETDAPLSKDQAAELRDRAEKTLGSAYDVIVLASGLKGKIIPTAMLKAD